jgi:hypothetical protein
MFITRKVECFLSTHEMPATKFGRLCVGDPRLVHDMRKGRQFRKDMVDRVEAFMASYSSIASTQHREHIQ